MAVASLASSSDRARIYEMGAQKLADAQERLATGKRVLRLGDDPASILTATPLQTQTTLDRSARSNSAAGISLIQAVQQGLQQIQLLVDTLSGIATQGTDTSLSGQQRAQLQAQFQGNRTAIDAVAATTQFNGMALLDGSLATPNGLDYAVGVQSALRVSIPAVTSGALFSGATPDVSNVAKATLAVGQVAAAQTVLSSVRGVADSYVQRFDAVQGNLQATLGGVNAAITSLLAVNKQTQSLSVVQQFLQQNTAAVIQAQAQQFDSRILNLL